MASSSEAVRVRPPAVAGSFYSVDPETLIVISTDLSHYLPYEAARRFDARTCQLVMKLEPRLDGERACGYVPLNGMLLAARRRGLRIAQLDLRNSGDTAGDRTRVVGYGAFAIYE